MEKEGKGARSDGRGFRVVLSPPTPASFALAYNLGNFLRTLATPGPVKDWSLTSQKDKLIKIGAKVVSRRYVAFQMAEVAIPRNLFADVLRLIADCDPNALRPRHSGWRVSRVRWNPQEKSVLIAKSSALF
jgi:hypothetical protein